MVPRKTAAGQHGATRANVSCKRLCYGDDLVEFDLTVLSHKISENAAYEVY